MDEHEPHKPAVEATPPLPHDRVAASSDLPPPPGLDMPAGGAAPRRRKLAAIVGVAALLAGGLGFLLLRPGGTALAFSFSKGRTTHFHMTMTMSGSIDAGSQGSFPIDSEISTDAQWDVLSVDEIGTATVEQSFSNTKLTANGQEVAGPGLPTGTFRMTTDGRLLSTTGQTLFGGGAQAPAQIGGDRLSAVLPDGAVRPGSTWSKSVTQTIWGTDLTYSIEGSYVRDEQVGSVRAAVVRTKGKIPMDFTVKLSDIADLIGLPQDTLPADATITYAGETTSDTTTWIDPDAEALLKTMGHSEFSIGVTAEGLPEGSLPPGGFTMKGTMSLTLEVA